MHWGIQKSLEYIQSKIYSPGEQTMVKQIDQGNFSRKISGINMKESPDLALSIAVSPF